MSLRQRLSRAPRWEAVLAAWLERIDDAGGPSDIFTADAATDVVETLLTRPGGIDAALGRFGRSLGAAGYGLDQTAAWVRMLGQLVPVHARGFDRFDAGLALARGWSQGHLAGVQASASTDATTGLHTEAVLQMRLQQAYAYATSIDVPVTWLHALVVISASVPPSEPFRREATFAVLGDLVRRHWTAGETAAVLGDRVLVLCTNTSSLVEQTAAFVASADRLGLLRTAAVVAWVEPLPDRVDALERFLGELAE